MVIIKNEKPKNKSETFKTRIILQHETHLWPDAIKPHLCPYALKMASEIGNITLR